jgi:dTDP-4-dehydrorhamnose reductase
MSIFITGANGQLGRSTIVELKKKKFKYFAFSKSQLDITNFFKINSILKKKKPDIVLNFASYNDVDKAEKEPKLAFLINAEAVKNLAVCCSLLEIPLIHISTDYVFYGKLNKHYNYLDPVRPKSVYGLSKLKGEMAIKKFCKYFLIIRTSRLFSKYKNNFLHTIVSLIKKKNLIKIVNDQYSCPTSAETLAKAIVKIIPIIIKKKFKSKIYHYANKNSCSWYDFAKQIVNLLFKFKFIAKKIIVKPIPAKKYSISFKKLRPKFSGLDSTIFCKKFKINNPNWKNSLKNVIKSL